MTFLRFLFLVALLYGCASASKPSTSLPHHGWDESPDFSELRRVWGDADNFAELCEAGRPLNGMIEKMNAEQWESAAAMGLRWLEQCPVDIRGHYFTAVSLEESGRDQDAEAHYRWTKGLMDSLVASGDGESPETAYVTISVAEEYDALYFFGLEKKSQTLISGPIMCDLLTATNEEGKTFRIYFNPAAHFVRLAKWAGEVAEKIEKD